MVAGLDDYLDRARRIIAKVLVCNLNGTLIGLQRLQPAVEPINLGGDFRMDAAPMMFSHSRDEGLSTATLYQWRNDARDQGRLLPEA